MKKKFPAYYRIHKEDVLQRFDECAFVLDASALLDIFRLKKDVTEKVFNVMEHYVKQIVVPYHAAEEYNRRIHTVLNDQLNNIKSSRKSFISFIQTFSGKRSMPYLSAKADRMICTLKKKIETEYKAQEDYIKDQLIHGEYQNKIADLLDGRVLEPFSKEEIEDIKKEGEQRYKDKVPPGWKDADKGENRYGDLINWKEILKYAKSNKKCIIFIANDEKPDWICKENGMTIGPQYELLKEFYSEIESNDRFLFICTLDRFLSLVNEKRSDMVSEDTIREVRDTIYQEEIQTMRDITCKSAMDKQRIAGADVPCIEDTVKTSESLKATIHSIAEFQDKMRATMTPSEKSKAVTREFASGVDKVSVIKGSDKQTVDNDCKQDRETEDKKNVVF